MPGSPVPAGNAPWGITVDPAGGFVYVANIIDGTVSGYSINSSTGALTPLNGSPFKVGGSPESVAVGIEAKLLMSSISIKSFLYVANLGGVSGFSVESNGNLTEIEGSPFAVSGDLPISVTVDSTGRYAYVANETGADVVGYAVNADTGALTALPSGPWQVNDDLVEDVITTAGP